MNQQRIITYRAKGVNPCYGWVEGGLYYTDNNHNEPFNTMPIITKYFIVSYFSGDWNMGKWEHVEVHPKTIQQFTGCYDSFTNKIYEGDVIRVRNVSYDEDGTRLTSIDFTEGVVVFEDGAFMFNNGEKCLVSSLKSITTEIEVVGNALTLKKNKTANEYRANMLINEFEKHINDTYPEHIDAAFITFAKEASQILMEDYTCIYDKNKQALTIIFKNDYNKYLISKNNLEDKPEYQLYVCCDKGLLQSFVKMKKDSDFQTIINTIEKNPIT